jgi:branched-subunit amino acid transport protein
MTGLVAMVLLAVASYVLRVLFVLLVPAEKLPGAIRDALGHLPPAVLGALVSVEVAGAVRGLDLAAAAFLLATLLTAGVAVRLTGSMGLGVSIGLVGALLIDLVLV